MCKLDFGVKGVMNRKRFAKYSRITLNALTGLAETF